MAKKAARAARTKKTVRKPQRKKRRLSADQQTRYAIGPNPRGWEWD
jgi:hypothetical protein